jgi:hypothetical protein
MQTFKSRTIADLSESIIHRLNAYALGATAAGVGVLALNYPAEAKIVYTPTHQIIRLGQPYALDLNHDGTNDFSMLVTSCQKTSTLCPFTALEIRPDSVNSVAGGSYSTYGGKFAHALKGGSQVPGKHPFVGDGILAFSRLRRRCGGSWFDVKDRYLGLAIFVDGNRHYGWARMNVRTSKDPFTVTGILTGYAYETIVNKPIIAGKTKGPEVITMEPGSLGALAAGVARRSRK